MIIRNQRRRCVTFALLVILTLTVPSHGQDGTDSPASAQVNSPSGNSVEPENGLKPTSSYLESGGNYYALTDNLGYWGGGYTHAVLTAGNNVWTGEINGQHEFGDAGVYFGAGDTYNINPDWYASAAVGSSAGGFFWPRFRTDEFLNKKWRARKQLITTLGFGYYEAKDVHRDHNFFFGATYYFEKPWIVEEGIRFNVSNPGSVFAPSGFVAVTQGKNKHRYVTVRAGFGEEAYQLIGPASVLTDFNSQTLTITWRQWAGRDWGFNFVADYYHNPFYMRGGSSFGFFKDF